LREIQKLRKGEEDVSSYWMNLRNRRYWVLKDEALYHTVTRFEKGYGPVVRQNT
jgi:hypothetical protein